MCSILPISIASTQFCTQKSYFFAFKTSTTASLATTLHQLTTRFWHRENSQPDWFQVFTNFLPPPTSKIVTWEHSHSRFQPDTTRKMKELHFTHACKCRCKCNCENLMKIMNYNLDLLMLNVKNFRSSIGHLKAL